MSNSLALTSVPAGQHTTGTSVQDEYRLTAQRYHGRLCAAAYRILRDRDEAEDAVQEAHVHALKHLDQFEGRAALSTWLTQIVVNEALVRLRRRVPSVSLDNVILRSKRPDPEQEIIAAQLRNMVDASIQALPPTYRATFFVRHVCDLSGEEAAAQLGVTVGCVKARLHRAKDMLQSKLRARVGAPRLRATQPQAAHQ